MRRWKAKLKISTLTGAWFDMDEVAIAARRRPTRRARGKLLCSGRLVWLVALAFLAAAEHGAVGEGTSGDGSDEAVETWTVEVNRSMPLAYRDERGTWRGFEIDRLNDIAQQAGRAVAYRPLSNPENRFQALIDGTADIVLGGNSITAEREALEIDFTYPTFDSGQRRSLGSWQGVREPTDGSGVRLRALGTDTADFGGVRVRVCFFPSAKTSGSE